MARSRDDVGVHAARAAVVRVTRGTSRAPARQREATNVVPRAPGVIGRPDANVSETSEPVVAIASGTTSETQETSALSFIARTPFVTQRILFDWMRLGTAPTHGSDAFRESPRRRQLAALVTQPRILIGSTSRAFGQQIFIATFRIFHD